MIEGLIKQFAGSGEAAQLIATLQQKGLTAQQAQGALSATAEGAAQMGPELMGSAGGVTGALAGLMGSRGGGLGGVASGGDGNGLSPKVVDSITQLVAQKTGLSPDRAKGAVKLILPKVIAFAKSKIG